MAPLTVQCPWCKVWLRVAPPRLNCTYCGHRFDVSPPFCDCPPCTARRKREWQEHKAAQRRRYEEGEQK